jgi:hypothetical protein
MQIDSALRAFSDSASISAGTLSNLIRITMLGLFFIWAAWCVLQLMQFYKQHLHASITSLLKDYVHVAILVTIVISLTFI